MAAKRQRVKPGDILAIHLSSKNGESDNLFAFARVFDSAVGIYAVTSTTCAPPENIGSRFLFVISVYNNVLSSGEWPKVGRDDRPAILPNFFKKDMLSGEFSIYDTATDNERPASEAECQGMERLAVWHREIVESRVRAHLLGEKPECTDPALWVPDELELQVDGSLQRVAAQQGR